MPMSRHSSAMSYKGYLAVFVRMESKAVHLEAISGHGAESFIAAYTRLGARL